jgi:translation initiation factor 1
MSKKKRGQQEAKSLEETLGDTWANPFKDLHLDLPKPEEDTKKTPPPAPPQSQGKVQGRVLTATEKELLKAFGVTEEEMAARLAAQQAGQEAPPPKPKGPKLSFAVERKGRGGKTVTLVRGLAELELARQMELCSRLRAALGVGGRFVDGILELQGDQRERAAKWFNEKWTGL